MIFNPHSKAVIYDDEPIKIEPILKLFEKHLVPHLYVNFSTAPEERNEENKLKNIRLIFTDFIKGNLTTSSPNGQLTNIINAIVSTISKENGPIIIVTWSAHSNQFLGQFKKQLKEAGYIFETIMLEKEKYLNNPNIDELLSDINQKLTSIKHFMCFLDLENKIKTSASKIIEPFTNLNEGKRERIIKNLSKASLGSAYNISPENLNKGFYNTMTNLLYDEMEKNIYVNTQRTSQEDENNIAEDIAYINTKLMIDKNILGNDSNYPGNVYEYKNFITICNTQNDSLHDICGFDIEDLKNSIFVREHIESVLNDDLKMICIEINPYCDHAQQNIRKAKLISGFILNEEQHSKVKTKSDFIYNANNNQFFLFNNNQKNYIYLSFRHIFRVKPEIMQDLNPIFRLRKEMVNEIQHQTAFYLSRPGLTTLYN